MQKLTNEELLRLTVNEFKAASKTPLIIVLDNVRSLNNVGSIFRTADAFRVEALYLCGITGKPPDREIQKTALGATETIAWHYFSSTNDAIRKLKSDGYLVVAVEQAKGATLLGATKTAVTKTAFVFGNEVKGVAQDIVSVADRVVEIPQAGTKHSLNIAVSVGIVVWDFFSNYNSK
jgi:23S rRNA (guanosine2251-2'-O)-methyltransferase